MPRNQLEFFKSAPKHFGGEHLIGKRKSARPIALKSPMHVVMRSQLARGQWSMLHPRHAKHVRAITETLARKHGIRLDQFANVGNHLHLLVRARQRRPFQRFLRELAGALAMMITGARKGVEQKFWDARAFTRIVEWGRDLRNLEIYFIKNMFEAAGLFGRKAKAQGLRVVPLFGRLSVPG